jgi:hypothetical protein
MVDYCAAADVYLPTNKMKPTPEDNTVFAALITAASRAIDNHCNRPDGFIAASVASARQYTGSGDYVQFIDECVSITLVETKLSITDSYTAWAATDWLPFSGDPLSPNFNGLPYDALMTSGDGSFPLFHSGRVPYLRGFQPDVDNTGRALPTVRITAKWGASVAVPEAIKQACIIQVARWYKRGQSGWADTLASNDFGQLMFTKALDPAIVEILDNGRYVKPATGRR